MGKDKSRFKMKKGKKKKTFLETQKKHKQEVRRVAKDPAAKKDETRFRFETFSSQVAGVEASIVYQLAGAGAVRVDPDSSTSLLSETLNYWRDLNLSSMFQECDKRLSRYTSLAQASQHREVL